MQIILNKIKEYDKIIILGHKRPDGDCYGSQFGLKDIIETTYPNKKVIVTGDVSTYVSFLGDTQDITDDEFKGSLVIIVDTSTVDRMFDLRYKLADYVIRIDHHIKEVEFADYEWIDSTYPSCTLMITEFLNEFKDELKITTKGATALYTGIITDTGRFRYEGVNSKTLKLASTLLDHGVNVSDLDKRLSSESLETLRLRGYVLSNFKTTDEGFIYITFPNSVKEQFDLPNEEIANQVGFLSNIKGFPVWALVIEYPDEIRIRLRSNGPNVNELAGLFGGGGHAKAAGGKLNSWDELDTLINACNKLVTEYKNSLT